MQRVRSLELEFARVDARERRMKLSYNFLLRGARGFLVSRSRSLAAERAGGDGADRRGTERDAALRRGVDVERVVDAPRGGLAHVG